MPCLFGGLKENSRQLRQCWKKCASVATGAARSKQISVLRVFSGIGRFQNIIIVQVTRTFYRIKDSHGAKLMSEVGPIELIAD